MQADIERTYRICKFSHVPTILEQCGHRIEVRMRNKMHLTEISDRTVSVWDIRSGLPIQTFFGHENSINHVTFNRLAS